VLRAQDNIDVKRMHSKENDAAAAAALYKPASCLSNKLLDVAIHTITCRMSTYLSKILMHC